MIKHFNEIRLFLEQNAIAINESKVDNFISDIEMHIACYNLITRELVYEHNDLCEYMRVCTHRERI